MKVNALFPAFLPLDLVEERNNVIPLDAGHEQLHIPMQLCVPHHEIEKFLNERIRRIRPTRQVEPLRVAQDVICSHPSPRATHRSSRRTEQLTSSSSISELPLLFPPALPKPSSTLFDTLSQRHPNSSSPTRSNFRFRSRAACPREPARRRACASCRRRYSE